MVYDNTTASGGDPTTASSTPKSRMCPNARSCWPNLSYHSWSVRSAGDKRTLARRICMLLILGLRTAISVFTVVLDGFGGRVMSLIVGIILGVLGFFFVAWCLQTVGDMMPGGPGPRRLFGVRVGRDHFDAFLALCALVHVAIFVGFFVGASGVTLSVLWIVMLLVLWAAAWVVTWEPEMESRSAGIV